MDKLKTLVETTVDSDINLENSLLVAFIMSDEFCKEIVPIVKVEYFSAIYSQIVLKWIVRYYNKWKKSPKLHIQDIFNAEAEKLNKNTVENIELFLQELSDNYSVENNNNFNTQYFIEKAKIYIKKKGLTNIIIRSANFIDEGNIVEAEKELTKIKKIVVDTSIKWKKPFSDSDYIDRVINADNSYLFQFEGKLGELTGPLKRNWLIAFMGPRKRGKSFFLTETAILAALSGLKTVFISLEMNDEEVAARLFQRVLSSSINCTNRKVKIPVFDCLKNQEGTCNLTIRVNRKKLFNVDERIIPKSKYLKDYCVCTVCRGKNDNFVPSIWYDDKIIKPIYTTQVVKKAKALTQSFGLGKNFVILSYPAFTASLSDIAVDLQRMEDYEGFVPDVIVIDYADILKPEAGADKDRDSIDITWMTMKSIAATRKCLLCTATQSNRKSGESRNVKSIDVAEDIRKFNHVDVAFSINQLEDEKRIGIIRIGVAAHRHRQYLELQHAIVLQQLEIGQVLLDSELCPADFNIRIEK
ncbi:MAG: hypothetical protein KKB38_20770 [Gammaproteobacteria bacterium]|nr:hypothetical protein [Gammaproteobacteria bacterium]